MDSDLDLILKDPKSIRLAIISGGAVLLSPGAAEQEEAETVPLPEGPEDELYPEDSASRLEEKSPSTLDAVAIRVSTLETRMTDLQMFSEDQFKSLMSKVTRLEGLVTNLVSGIPVHRRAISQELGLSGPVVPPTSHDLPGDRAVLSIDLVTEVTRFIEKHPRYPLLKPVRDALVKKLSHSLDRSPVKSPSEGEWTVQGLVACFK